MGILEPKYNNLINKHQTIGPTNILGLAKELGIKTYTADDFDDIECGSIEKEADGYHIYINISHAPSTRVFTIAHELSHFLIHKNEIDKQKELIDSVKQPSLNLDYLGESINDRIKIDKEANELAFDILMPEGEFRRVWKTSNSTQEVAKHFGVGSHHVAIRASKLLGEMMM